MATFNLKEYNKELEDWALIQSDPAIFNDMLKEYKVEDVKVQELYTLDFDELMEGPVYGLIFASRYIQEDAKSEQKNDPDAEDIIFTRQIITNVCATLALVAVLFNCGLQLGDILSDFLQLTATMSPEERGTALGDCEDIKRVHNSYNVPNPLAEVAVKRLVEEIIDDEMEYVDSEDFHYIAYVPKSGFLWEIDGLQERPKKLCSLGDKNWVGLVKPYIESRMSAQGDQLTFNLMAVTDDRNKKHLEAFKKIKEFFMKCQKAANKSNDCSGLRAAVEQLKRVIPEGTKHYDFALPIIEAIENNDCDTFKDALSELIPVLESRVKEIKDRKYDEDQKQKEVNQQKANYRRFIQKLSKAIPKIEQKQQKAKVIKDKKLMKVKPPKRSPLTKRQRALNLRDNDASLDPVESSANSPLPIDDTASTTSVTSILDITSVVEDIVFVSTDKKSTEISSTTDIPASSCTDTVQESSPVKVSSSPSENSTEKATTTDIPVVVGNDEADAVAVPEILIVTEEHPTEDVTTAVSTHSDHMDNHSASMQKISIFTDIEDSDMAESADFVLSDSAISVAHVTDDFCSIPIAKDTFFTDIDSDYFNEVIKALLSKVTPTSASPSSVSAEIATSVAMFPAAPRPHVLSFDTALSTDTIWNSEYFSHSPVEFISTSPLSPNPASSPSPIDECSLDQLPQPAVDHKRSLNDDEEHPVSARPKKAKKTPIKSQRTKRGSVSNISPPSKKIYGTRSKRMGNEE
ncbi:hypothetical protein BDB01DRAFT_809598 [Pilobolus umbonatus]|nr:hypothetical protein BDB01DRAFT_809598 [Pilobolus umbonatus]